MSQPPLYDHITCLAAPATWLSPPNGQLSAGVDGLYVADRRVLSRFALTVDGDDPVFVAAELTGSSSAVFTGAAGALTVERHRTALPDGGSERIVVRNGGEAHFTGVLEVTAETDLAPISSVKERQLDPDREHTALAGEFVGHDGYRVALDGITHAELSLAPGETFETTLTVRATPPPTDGFHQQPYGPAPWAGSPLTVTSGDERLDGLVGRGVGDLAALLLADEGEPYCAAGSPWYLTLFGRDSLLTARMALPLGYELAAGTLRALARRQGVRHELITEEEPGKIPHELRPEHATNWLPPVYYGTVDATPLFVVTLHEAWRWGMPAEEVAALLPAVERALGWLGTFEEFVSYRGVEGKLVNQGWKDSKDSVQFSNGRLATPPVALAEVQGYAYQAAMLGAELLDAFGRRGGGHWRAWASELADRFRARFWIDDADGAYPAIAVDGEGRAVDGLASNIGHLFGTGLLDAAEEERAAARLAELDSGWGLRTLTDRVAGYDPLSYHLGSVWPHDTAITILGLTRAGRRDLAGHLASGLVAAAPYFEHRLPELYGGGPDAPPAPYPPSCRPQAWAAAVAPALVTALLGLDVDVPGGRLTVSPAPGAAGLTVENLRVGDSTLSIRVDDDGTATVSGTPPGLTVG